MGRHGPDGIEMVDSNKQAGVLTFEGIELIKVGPVMGFEGWKERNRISVQPPFRRESDVLVYVVVVDG